MRVIADNQKDNHMTLYDIYVFYLHCSPSQQMFQTYCSFMLIDINSFQ